ncbi:MAG TPA: DUF2461 domain-containing protein [Candidatus Saccharimonadales bacterium]|nr:DUF2461 domain-containing protein [Candidatus Saccharimonadales bacterium]
MPTATETAGFTGFRPEAIQFMADLVQNNDRAWFQPRKAEYERLIKQPAEALVAALAARFEARGLPLRADPKRSVFRIYRDTRFSKDKSPYKRHIGASFPWIEGARDDGSDERRYGNGAYFNFEPGQMYVGGGMWMPDKPRLDAFRAAIVADPARVRAALEDPGFIAAFGPVVTHDSLKRLPAGLPADHPMAHLFLFKDVVFGRHLSDEEVQSPALPDVLTEGYAAAVPVFRFLATLGD